METKEQRPGEAVRPRRRLCVGFLVGALILPVAQPAAQDCIGWVTEAAGRGDFPLVQAGQAASIVIDPEDFAVVTIAVRDLAGDIEQVTGRRPLVRAFDAGCNFSLTLTNALNPNSPQSFYKLELQ